MVHTTESHGKLYLSIAAFVIVILTGTLVYGYLEQTELKEAYTTSQQELRDTKAALAEREAKIAEHAVDLEGLRQAYALSEENGAELLSQLTDEKNRNEAFEDQINDITGTVGKLDKLSKIDSELLQKYSKVYFLNEHYMPGKVVEIPKQFTFKQDEPEYIHAQIINRLKSLLEDAEEDGINLRVVSAFRSFDEQKSLKGAYSTVYGSGANAFSADQGYSEHQLGTTLDFTTAETNGILTGFENTTAYAWLLKNAHKYGFVLSYPKDNAYYVFEPWHWRFVGRDLARDLHSDGKFFYDLDQREIDEYLIELFD